MLVCTDMNLYHMTLLFVVRGNREVAMGVCVCEVPKGLERDWL